MILAATYWTYLAATYRQLPSYVHDCPRASPVKSIALDSPPNFNYTEKCYYYYYYPLLLLLLLPCMPTLTNKLFMCLRTQRGIDAHSEHRFPGTLLQTLPDLVTPLKGHSLSPRSCPPTGSAPPERFGY